MGGDGGNGGDGGGEKRKRERKAGTGGEEPKRRGCGVKKIRETRQERFGYGDGYGDGVSRVSKEERGVFFF